MFSVSITKHMSVWEESVIHNCEVIEKKCRKKHWESTTKKKTDDKHDMN